MIGWVLLGSQGKVWIWQKDNDTADCTRGLVETNESEDTVPTVGLKGGGGPDKAQRLIALLR